MGYDKFQRPLLYWANNTIHDHKRLGIPVNITRGDLALFASRVHTCAYCGKELKVTYDEVVERRNRLSVDRIDNSKPLEIGNILICCWLCGCRKECKTLEEWKETEYGTKKKCVRCGQLKSVSQFYSAKRGKKGQKIGHMSRCKECVNRLGS